MTVKVKFDSADVRWFGGYRFGAKKEDGFWCFYSNHIMSKSIFRDFIKRFKKGLVAIEVEGTEDEVNTYRALVHEANPALEFLGKTPTAEKPKDEAPATQEPKNPAENPDEGDGGVNPSPAEPVTEEPKTEEEPKDDPEPEHPEENPDEGDGGVNPPPAEPEGTQEPATEEPEAEEEPKDEVPEPKVEEPQEEEPSELAKEVQDLMAEVSDKMTEAEVIDFMQAQKNLGVSKEGALQALKEKLLELKNQPAETQEPEVEHPKDEVPSEESQPEETKEPEPEAKPDPEPEAEKPSEEAQPEEE